MKTSTKKFRLALTTLAIVALLLAMAPSAVGPVYADPPVGNERAQTPEEPPETIPPRSPQEPTPANVGGQAEQPADLQDLPCPKLAAEPGCGAGPWVIVVLNSGGTDPQTHKNLPGALYTVDTATDTLYGPFLQGQLGSAGGGLFDVAVTPHCGTAVVSNFGDSTVFFVDVSDPTDLKLLGSVNLGYFAEDIAITPNCKYALVADGGFSPRLASINMATGTLVEVEGLGDAYANAVAVAPDGTVIVADYFGMKVHTLTVGGSGHLTFAESYDIPMVIEHGKEIYLRPVNVAVAPDGRTVLVLATVSDHVPVYRITGPGTLEYMGLVEGLPAVWNEDSLSWSGSQQSAAFSCDGTRAYVLTNGRGYEDPQYPEETERPSQISVLGIAGPGNVNLITASAADIPDLGSSQLFGVDVLAVADGKLYVSNPTVSGGETTVSVVDLNSYSVSTIPVGPLPDAIPTGVAAFATSVNLTVEVVQTGMATGLVSSDIINCDPGGISCGTDCTETYCAGTVVTLRAYPGLKSYLASWSGDCVSTGGLTAQVTMDADKHCIATFGYPVGGIVVPVNKLGLVALRLRSGQAPWMGLVALAGLAALGVVLVRRRRA